MAEFLAHYESMIAIAILAVMFAAFVIDRYPPEVVAAAAAATTLLLGLVSSDEAMNAFANPAPLTIAAMFILSGALVRTGVLEAIANLVTAQAANRPIIAFAGFIAFTMAASAFVNNTPVVLVLIPVVIKLAKSIGIAPTKLLIPLSYVAILGGTCTLIGTSTNLLVDGVARGQGLEPFSIFEITPVGIAVGITGLATMAALGRFLLPDRGGGAEDLLLGETEFLTEASLLSERFNGRKISDIASFNRPSIVITGIRRGGKVIRTDLDKMAVKKGDCLILRAPTSEVLTLNDMTKDVRIGLRGETPSDDERVVVEAVVAPRGANVGGTIAALPLGRRFGIRVLGAHRHKHVAGPELGKVQLKAADKLLIEGPPAAFDELASETALVSVSRPSGRAYRRAKAPIALLALAAVVGLSAFDVMEIGALAMVAVAFILLLRCIDADEAWGALDGAILVLIFSMLIVGQALENAGSVTLIVDAITPLLSTLPPLVALLVIYFAASLMTELVTNNAVAVVLTPVVIGLAEQLGLDPRAAVIAVMFGASASFATPIGYQTNTLVYGAANYRFTDFLKIGVPMNIVIGLVTVLVIWFWFAQS